MKKELVIALIPVLFLISLLSFNVSVFGDDALSGSNQFVLLLAAAVAALIGSIKGVKFDDILEGIKHSISTTSSAIIILLLIGSLSGAWMLSGIVPAMIYYGLHILSPEVFLPAAALICALVSLATGSSWSTTATVGIALIGIANVLEISTAMAAGAVISGAYFGDKLSPLSDTTNLAPAMAGTDLFTHIRYMMITTIPSFAIALIIFTIISISSNSSGELADVDSILGELDLIYNINPWLFVVPIGMLVLILKKMPAIPAMLIGILGGIIFALVFQTDLLLNLNEGNALNIYDAYKISMNSLTVSMDYKSTHPLLSDLLSSGGMSGMLGTIWLIICAMVFGGTMEACGFLETISSAILKLAKSSFSLIATTVGTCLSVNILASDQYLAIVVPGRMYAPAYKEAGLAPENLSRTLEDSGTVTSVLVPWNTCGAYQSGILGVSTMAYLPYAFFNLLSPVMTLIFAGFDLKIKKLKVSRQA